MWNHRTNQQPGHCRCIRDAGVYRRGRQSNQQPGHCRCIRDAGVYRHHGRATDLFGAKLALHHKQSFLQICLADEDKDAVRFLWSDDEPCVHKRPKLQVYRFNRVNFRVSSSPFLLAATIRHHIEKYKHEFSDTVELLDRNFYVNYLISGGNEFEEALQTSRRAKKYYGSCWNGPQKMDY
ncbi:uncharacterized protein TNCV_4983261 [Trichonephila clavipes]|uniref:Uncharacterized protein n=1 Tax=Trichonephila clavipes TaxID=2585209 RepID=A0A8X6WFS1_TRICX|nr:uncharacterized protein TNCV_4983261 [Trichonephila clavipes]